MKSTVFNKSLPIAIGCDHAGFECKEAVMKMLQEGGWQVVDKGTYSHSSVDYPDFAHPVAEMVAQGKATAGLLFCGSGNGVCMTANKHDGVRAALAWTSEIAILARQHNDANVLCVPARYVSQDVANRMVDDFLFSPFEGGRHERRVEKINKFDHSL
jgi:ribose 5-phosphate isomerase B